jgi:hypothetical protein
MSEQRPYDNWSSEELRNAEAIASQFLEEHGSQIAETMRAKARFLENLLQRVSLPQTTFADRLEYFARISEIARLIQDDADGFFGLASRPLVARLIRTVPRKQ